MNRERTIKVALAGCGTVGSGVLDIVVNRAESLACRTGVRFQVVGGLVADLSKKRSLPLDPHLLTDEPAALLSRDYDLLVEVMGGTTTARAVVLDALRAGKPVVTANKALLALHGAEVFRTAHAHSACVAFEASCAGGLPIVGAVLRGLQANRINQLVGIFNSTCNFVLTAMLDRGMTFADAVAEAQRSGYAEADPTLDVSGGDTAHKLTVLASLAFARNIEFSRIAMQGIDRLQLDDLRIAREMGYACKLLGIGRRVTNGPHAQNERLHLAVRPTLVPNAHPLAALTGASSGLWVQGDAVGETFYSGAGAGSLPTASAVVADMIEVATGATQATFNSLRIFNDQTAPAEYVDPGAPEGPFYVRFTFDSPRQDALSDLARALSDIPMRHERSHAASDRRHAVIITAPITCAELDTAVRAIASRLPLAGEPVVLPVLEV
jgi:homoserine dehydrogenase